MFPPIVIPSVVPKHNPGPPNPAPRIHEGRLQFPSGTIHQNGTDFSDGSCFEVNLADLEDQGDLGRGQFALVKKVRHKKTGVVMAVKRIHFDTSEATSKNVMTELSVLYDHTSPYIVDFYGAFFVDTQIYYCVEYMDVGSLDKLQNNGIPEEALSKIAFAVLQALKFLHDELKIIHRDVRPSNILVNSKGQVKVCDFNVSGNLENSLAKTVVGCQRYMSPDRILANKDNPYGVSSDIWSFGLSLVEMATGKFPYPNVQTVFAQLELILKTDPPSLSTDRFSPEFCDFVSKCVQRETKQRASLSALLSHPFLSKYPDYDLTTWTQTVNPHQQSR